MTQQSDWFPNFRLIRPSGHPPPDRFCDGTLIDQVRLIGEEDAMQRERHFVNRAGAQRGRPARACAIAQRDNHIVYVPHPVERRVWDAMCEWIIWLRKCLSTPPTPRKRAWLWLTEIRSRNLTLNPKTNAKSLATSILQK